MMYPLISVDTTLVLCIFLSQTDGGGFKVLFFRVKCHYWRALRYEIVLGLLSHQCICKKGIACRSIKPY